MPYALVIALQRTNDAPLPEAVGEYVHAALFHLIARGSPELAERLHAVPERKPFTLGPIQERRQARAGDTTALRLTFLDDALFPAFMDTLLASILQNQLRVGAVLFDVTGLFTTPETHPLAGSGRYADLMAATRDAERVMVRFRTPTVFRSQGKAVLWPEPRLVWQSWIRTWNAFCGASAPSVDEPALLEVVQQCVSVERYHLRTRRVVLQEGACSGFLGTCSYNLRAAPYLERMQLITLADFSFYAGTGRKTGMGMGQTQRIFPKASPRPALSAGSTPFLPQEE
ncbi:MAG: CRISPR system precrRNA processing endoribonuclease RAMP protein Cas6 [Chloroherpetonaceae bacterium]|nr:CRISPR system precrRNA processing endoribonuclease RAMP protein Cas6 [Chthonomonadaceae bacterium]MDW8209290.1 CRISPR system precrRNA processing endoribonuclease RAMP protein Cas6 [Chloroherpetonaceae bacterium]